MSDAHTYCMGQKSQAVSNNVTSARQMSIGSLCCAYELHMDVGDGAHQVIGNKDGERDRSLQGEFDERGRVCLGVNGRVGQQCSAEDGLMPADTGQSQRGTFATQQARTCSKPVQSKTVNAG